MNFLNLIGETSNLLRLVAQSPAPLPDFGQALLRMVVSLAIVLVVLAGVLFLLKRRMRITGQKPGSEMSVLETVSISARHRLVLVRVRDRTLLLGATETGISRLAEFGASGETSASKGFGEAWAAAKDGGGATPGTIGRQEEQT